MLDPEFARRLHRDIEGKKQNIKDWWLQIKWADSSLGYHNAIARGQHEIDVLQDTWYELRTDATT